MIFISAQAAQQARSLVYQNNPRKHKFPKQKYYLAQSQHQKQSHGLIAPPIRAAFQQNHLDNSGWKKPFRYCWPIEWTRNAKLG